MVSRCHVLDACRHPKATVLCAAKGMESRRRPGLALRCCWGRKRLKRLAEQHAVRDKVCAPAGTIGLMRSPDRTLGVERVADADAHRRPLQRPDCHGGPMPVAQSQLGKLPRVRAAVVRLREGHGWRAALAE